MIDDQIKTREDEQFSPEELAVLKGRMVQSRRDPQWIGKVLGQSHLISPDDGEATLTAEVSMVNQQDPFAGQARTEHVFKENFGDGWELLTGAEERRAAARWTEAQQSLKQSREEFEAKVGGKPRSEEPDVINLDGLNYSKREGVREYSLAEVQEMQGTLLTSKYEKGVYGKVVGYQGYRHQKQEFYALKVEWTQKPHGELFKNSVIHRSEVDRHYPRLYGNELKVADRIWNHHQQQKQKQSRGRGI